VFLSGILFNILFKLGNPLKPLFIKIIDLGLLIFISIPWFLYGEVIKPVVLLVFNNIVNIIENNTNILIYWYSFKDLFLKTFSNVLLIFSNIFKYI